MPRLPRLDSVGLLHHVMVRGIEKRDIFLDDTDRVSFVDRLSALLVETQTSCLAWALMTNHFHLLLRPEKSKLSLLMRRLLTGHAVRFNHRHHRVGHLFQNRYRSVVCEEDAYLLELVRYIHLNPVRAGLVADVESLVCYQWTGHSVLMGQQHMDGQSTLEILFRFGKNLDCARTAYEAYVADGVGRGHRKEFSGGGLIRSCKLSGADPTEEAFDERILGSGEFVEDVLETEHQILPQRRLDLDLVLAEISQTCGIQLEELCRPNKNRKIAKARAAACHLTTIALGYPGVAVARRLGITSPGVVFAARRGVEYVDEEWYQAALRNLKI